MHNTKVIDGLRRLASIQQPSQQFSTQEIADECGVTERAIALIEERARRRMFRILMRRPYRPMLRELFPCHPLFPCASS